MLREDRERALRKRALRNMENLKIGTKQLEKLHIHDTVQVQNQVGNYPSKWDITGTVVEVKPFDQYIIKVHGSGRLTTRNRKFLRKILPYAKHPADMSMSPSPESPAKLCLPIINDRSVEVPILNDENVEVGMPLQTEGEQTDENVATQPIEHTQGEAIRRSGRVTREPSRLVVDWKSKDYEKKTDIHDTCSTACCSIDYQASLNPAKPSRGGGINGDGHGSPSTSVQDSM